MIKPATPTPESTPSAEPLLCAACTRPLDLRSCVDRESLDAVYRDPRVARATEEMMARRAGRGRTRQSPSPSPSRGGGGVKKEDPTLFLAAASDPEAASADPEAASADPEAASADPFADVRLGGVGTFSAAAESCPRCARAPPSEWRVCSARGSPDARVWTPLWRDVAPASLEKTSSTERLSEPSEDRKRPDFFVSAAYAEALAHFQWHWSRGHPVLVRDAEGVGVPLFRGTSVAAAKKITSRRMPSRTRRMRRRRSGRPRRSSASPRSAFTPPAARSGARPLTGRSRRPTREGGRRSTPRRIPRVRTRIKPARIPRPHPRAPACLATR